MGRNMIVLFFIISTLLCGAIKLGILESDQNLVHICKMAIEDGQDAGHCTANIIQIQDAATCMINNPAKGTANAIAFHFQEHVEAFVNSRCESEILEIAGLARFWNSPVMIRAVTNPIISDQDLYPTVVQFGRTSALDFTYAIKSLTDYLNITSVVLVSSTESSFDHYSIVAGIEQTAKQQRSFSIEKFIEIDENVLRENKIIAEELRTATSTIIIGDDFNDLGMVLRNLEMISLSDDHYMIILICNQISEICTSSIKHIVADASIIILAPIIEQYKVMVDKLSERLNFTIKEEEIEMYVTMYDACYGFCFGTRHSSTVNGKKFAQSMRNQHFTDIFGNITLDGAGKRLQNYAFQWLPSRNDEFQRVMTLSMIEAQCTHGNKCFDLVTAKHMEAYRMMWKISKEDLKVIETKRSKEHAISDNLSHKRRQLDSYALVGTLKAEFMCFKQYKRIPWNKAQLKFLYELKSLNHNNLTNFIGICYNDLDRFYVLHTLIERASLEDFIYDQQFNVDDTFKCAFIRDILKGLQYLHKSSIGYHGLLSLKTCMIDTNWVLKLTNFGISTMLNELIDQNYIRTIELIPQQFYITVAPELLNGIQIGWNFPKGTAVGDIYSFGMMLYSIIFRIKPFDRLSLKEVLHNVVQKSLRPQIDNDNGDPLITLMCQCWNSVPEERPKLENIRQTIGTIFSNSKGNLVDQMIKMNEKYAQDLEHIVAERTSLLVEAQEQTDRLLCEMLPPSIAAQLKAGETIIPRNYESVTVGFCQIVEFMYLMEHCTPEQVISFLNEAFMTFDEVIKCHDAYKVETTGETYMMASGVPRENGGRHIFEIAEIALKIREKTFAYKVTAAPNWHLRVRIGFHCGPIAAGVIGLRSPRYCLFGDTVNFASRMQSNCEANQIQVAESTAKILMENSKYNLTKRGVVHVKGKGDVNTYWLNELILNKQQY
ncbi:Adenylate and Guanylate cyclase catalytic domain containing protein [Brugia malayi]|uniref:guanylate cyclase n=2 Tax=Onchocercidae TaxID=6296 RepID=A0A0I9R2T8_BRUMA|nr:Adenylate and Guanylate cyclase catalytic domain containing protein [Brugia malayi]CTP80981.1 Bm5163 [Brugia malayi]VIO89452.1 Adenylate and Guanylate cyclase catalytic domain containing protein [Brugia malayi]